MDSKNFPLEYFYIESITTFNYYFTTFAGAITITIAPFYLYILLTQSKSLGTYKWFLLNHSIWSICSEITLVLTKPCTLMPGGIFNYIIKYIITFSRWICSWTVGEDWQLQNDLLFYSYLFFISIFHSCGDDDESHLPLYKYLPWSYTKYRNFKMDDRR